MNALAVAVLLVAVAYTNASGILGAGVIGAHSARGALEGALGGQWIPDVPVAGPGLVGHAALAPGLGLGLGLGGLGGLGVGGLGLGGLGVGLGGHGIGLAGSRGALEGALGGQWIPDTHGK